MVLACKIFVADDYISLEEGASKLKDFKVTSDYLDGEQKVGPIPERRPPPAKRKKATSKPLLGGISLLPVPIWRCRVCGYLCARESPPEVCPICKAKKERFERFV